MIRRISTDEVRKSLVEQIKQKLRANDNYYGFDDEISECLLVTGQKIPCVSVELKEQDVLVFSLSIINVQIIEVGYDDLMVESLERILKAIPTEEHSLTIWACEFDDTGENNLILYQHPFTALPDCDDEAISYINEVIRAGWEKKDAYVYSAYLNPEHNGRYLTAVFE